MDCLSPGAYRFKVYPHPRTFARRAVVPLHPWPTVARLARRWLVHGYFTPAVRLSNHS
jgi:hypothetical protein